MPFIQCLKNELLQLPAKRVVLSGPSGFLGTRVLDTLVQYQDLRRAHSLDPGELILLSSSPGRMMERLSLKYGPSRMPSIRASRVDYYSQHKIPTWIDHLGSLGVGGPHSVFCNLAAVAGPVPDRSPDAMMDVNYRACYGAAHACAALEVGHFIQSSTQATNAERAGQVPYSRGKAMADFSLSRLTSLRSSVVVLGLLYSKRLGVVGQDSKGINLIDLSVLPLTPILGDGSAPLQPLEVRDAAYRIAWLALSDPGQRPQQSSAPDAHRLMDALQASNPALRIYDGVGPETMSMMEMLRRFSQYSGKRGFYPVYVGYRNMERLLNIASLGNLNRQFVSLLRSEQDGSTPPIVGDPSVFASLIPLPLLTLDDSFQTTAPDALRRRRFPLWNTVQLVWKHPRLIPPGISLSLEIIQSFIRDFGKK